ncbi:MAG: hypothetical protein ACYTGL_29075 [Planctomycetota bacterium]|jgi:hypothetical protein
MNGKGHRTIDTAVQSVSGEYARMLVVVHAAFALAWWLYSVLSEPTAIWMVLLCAAVVLRGLGQVGTGSWRPLFTVCVLLGLLISAMAFHLTEGGFASLAMVFFLGLKLATESMNRRRIVSQRE